MVDRGYGDEPVQSSSTPSFGLSDELWLLSRGVPVAAAGQHWLPSLFSDSVNMNRGARSDATRKRILDAAERLFAQHGGAAVSVRNVAAAADVNLAAIGYHFGSKDGLFEALFSRRAAPLTSARLAALDALQASSAPQAPPLEQVLEAFISPPLSLATQGQAGMIVMQFLARAFSLPEGEAAFLDRHYEPVRSRFIAALAAAAPHLGRDEVIWRYNMLVGAIVYAMAGPTRMGRPPLADSGTAESTSPPGAAEAVRRMIAYAAGGFAASSTAGASSPALSPLPSSKSS